MGLDVGLYVTVDENKVSLYDGCISHNLVDMAEFAGLYSPVWHPNKIGVTKAKELDPLLEAGLRVLKSNPAKAKSFDPDLKKFLGNYENFVTFTENYLAACWKFPSAFVEALG